MYTCVGSGFIALDIIIEDGGSEKIISTGGSCGNVVSLVSYLGGKSKAIARLGNDLAGEKILSDLKNYRVNIDDVYQEDKLGTPIVIEHLKSGKHRFSTNCPICGAFFPRYSPFLIKDSRNLSEALETKIFYFDRATPANIELAKSFRKSGSIVIFEPQSCKDEVLFKRALIQSDIVKYSGDRIDYQYFEDDSGPSICVETLGIRGLRYRRRVNSSWSEWIALKAYEQKYVKDSTGSGDWCSAALILEISKHTASLDDIDNHSIEQGLKLGQSLATINCAFLGAKGAAENISMQSILDMARKIMDGEVLDISNIKPTYEKKEEIRHYCKSCTR